MARKEVASKKAIRVSGRRRTNEQKQEKKSRYQLALAWDDWPLQSNAEDLGEDLLFQIYAEGNFTGISFYVQLKSTSAIDALARKKTSHSITYSFETKDLLHWEGSVPPVVLLVWDVTQQLGHWQDVPAVLKALDAKGKSWRAQKTVAVRLPRKQTTDEAGRAALRTTLAHLAYPMFSSGKTIRMRPKFSFPKTKKGRALADSLRKTIDEGGSVKIGREYITEFTMSPWWEKAFGKTIPEFITISTPTDSAKTLPVRLHAIAAERTEALSVELSKIASGRKQTTLANAKGGAIEMTLVVKGTEISMNIEFNHPCKSLYESLSLTKFLIALQQGAALHLTSADGSPFGRALKFDPKGGRPVAELLIWQSLLQKLTFIHSRVARFGSFNVEALRDEDIPKIERVWTILQTGEYRAVMSFSFHVTGPPDFSAETPETLSLEVDPFGNEVLLGVTIPLGHVRLELLDPAAALRAFSEVDYTTSEPHVKIQGMPVLLRCIDWAPGKDGPDAVSPTGTKPADAC